MKRKWMKKAAAFLLLLAMTITMVNPISLHAEEDAEYQTENQEDDGSDGQEETLVIPKEETQKENGQYDTTKPVIEKIEFLQQGETLKADDIICLYVYAYDADSKEGEGLNVEAMVGASGSTTHSFVPMSSSFSEEKGCYVCEYKLPGGNIDQVYINTIRVTDTRGNYKDAECQEKNGAYKYWASVEPQELKEVHVKKLSLKQDGQTLDQNDTLDLWVETEETIADGYDVYVRFQNKQSIITVSLFPTDDADRKTFSGRQLVGNGYDDGEWTLRDIYMRTRLGEEEPLLIDDKSSKFTLKKNAVDTVTKKEKPVITSVTVDRNGEVLSAGDRVEIIVKAASQNGTLSKSASLDFSPASNIANGRKSIILNYNADKDAYCGVFEITKDTYPCEWSISYIWVTDTDGNAADCYDLLKYRPYYVKVENGGKFVNPTYNVNFAVYALDETGNWESVQKVQVENVERRQTLKEAGIKLPEMSSKYPGLTQIGWEDNRGTLITEETEITEDLFPYVVYARYDKKVVNVNYSFLKEEGKVGWKNEIAVIPENATYGDIKKQLENAAEPEESYPGIKFKKWDVKLQNNENEIFAGNGIYTFSVTAVYDKNFVTASYNYIDKEGKNWHYTDLPITFEPGDTYGDAIKEAEKFLPEDMTEVYQFERWETRLGIMSTGMAITADMEISSGFNPSGISLTAKYSGKAAIKIIDIGDYNEKGYHMGYPFYGSYYPEKILVVDEGTKGSEIIEILNNWEMPKFYSGLRFKEWEISIGADDIVKDGQSITRKAVFENCIVRYMIDPMFKGVNWGSIDERKLETIFCQVVEKGEKVTFPKTFEGYEEVVWLKDYSKYQPGDTFVVDQDMQFLGYGSKSSEGSKDPEQPSTPGKPGQTEQPSAPGRPGETEQPSTPGKPESSDQPNTSSKPEDSKSQNAELETSVIDETIKMIQSAEPGTSIRIDMNGATVVSKEILEAAKGKNINIQLQMNGYTWTINGMDIMAGELKSINLAVVLDTKNIPNATIQALAGNNPIRQLSLAHEGDFGFKASLTVNMGSEYSGMYGNLYYHDSDGKMVFINAGQINSTGDVSLQFSHASDYVVVMSAKEMSQSDVPAAIAPKAGSSQGASQAVKTGDNTVLFGWIVSSISAMGMILFLIKKRRSL